MHAQSKPGVVLDDRLTWRAMTLLVKIATVFIWVVFVLYLVLLLKLLLFARAGVGALAEPDPVRDHL